MQARRITQFEADLLRVLHAILGRAPVAQALQIILNASTPPRCLSANSVTVVRDALAKGLVHWLAANGGWRRDRHLREARPVAERLWKRSPVSEMRLEFSRHSLGFLLWLTATRPGEWPVSPEQLTV